MLNTSKKFIKKFKKYIIHITNNIKQIETSSKQSQKNDKKYSHKNLPPTKTSTSSTKPLSPSSLSIIIITFIITLTIISQSSVFAASSPSCYTPIPSKPGCSGLTSINDVKHKGQLKCFTIDKKAKDCGVFVNVLPTDTDQGLINSLGTLNCTGEDRNTPECADYCHNNPDTTPSECVRCDTLSEEQKIQYSYCSNEYCEAIIDYGNGSSWPTVPAGTVNVSGDCLEGYTGAPIRNCLEGGIWNGIISGACVPISGCDNALLNTNNEVPYAIFPIIGTTEVDQQETATTCETGYEMTGSVYAVCQSDGTWQYGNSNPLVDVADSCLLVDGCNSGYASDIDLNVLGVFEDGVYGIGLCESNGVFVMLICNNGEWEFAPNHSCSLTCNFGGNISVNIFMGGHGETSIGECIADSSSVEVICNSGEWEFAPGYSCPAYCDVGLAENIDVYFYELVADGENSDGICRSNGRLVTAICNNGEWEFAPNHSCSLTCNGLGLVNVFSIAGHGETAMGECASDGSPVELICNNGQFEFLPGYSCPCYSCL